MYLGANLSNANYNAISLNGNNTDSSRIGMTGGGAADNSLYVDATGDINFRPSGSATLAVTFESGGQVGIGDSTPDYGLDVVADINSDDCFREAGSQIAGTCASDERLKENITPIDDSLDKILKLNPVNFDWKKGIDENEGIRYVEGVQTGLIAQEVQEVFPEWVQEKHGFLAVKYNLEIQMRLIKAIQELQAQIDELKINQCY